MLSVERTARNKFLVWRKTLCQISFYKKYYFNKKQQRLDLSLHNSTRRKRQHWRLFYKYFVWLWWIYEFNNVSLVRSELNSIKYQYQLLIVIGCIIFLLFVILYMIIMKGHEYVLCASACEYCYKTVDVKSTIKIWWSWIFWNPSMVSVWLCSACRCLVLFAY